MEASEGESLSKQATTPLKPRGSATFGTGLGDPGDDIESDFSCAACLHSSALQCWALLSPTLPSVAPLPQLTKSQRSLSGGGCQLGGWDAVPLSSQQNHHRKLLPFTSPHAAQGGISGSSAGLLMVAIGAVSSSVGSSVGAASLVVTSMGSASSVGSSVRAASSVGSSVGAASSVGTLAGTSSLVGSSVGAGWVFPRIFAWVCPSRDLSQGAALAKRHGQPGIGGLDFSAQYCRACA